MAAIVILLALLLSRASADGDVTTLFRLPNGLFWDKPSLQQFVGQATTSASVTYYTIDCGAQTDAFWPGSSACLSSNSYTFSADPTATHYLMP